MLPAIAMTLALAPAFVGGPVLEDILNPIVRDQGTIGLDTERALTIEPGGSLGQTFVTGDGVVELYRVVIWQAFWHETWDPDERLVLTLWDSPEKIVCRGRDEVPYDRRMWESALTMFVLEAPVASGREYYIELTVEREPLRPAEVPTEWILAGERPGAAGGDGKVGGIGCAEQPCAAGQAYRDGRPSDEGVWFETHVRRVIDRDALYAEAFGRLDLDYPPLAQVRDAVLARDWDRACDALIAHFESREDLLPPEAQRPAPDPFFDTREADLAAAHRVLLDDGTTVDLGPRFSHFTLWPERGGVGLTRSGLRKPLAAGYAHTGSEKYARAFNELIRTFLTNHPSPLRAGVFRPDETIPAALPPGLAGGSMWSGLAIGARMSHGLHYYGIFMESPSFTRDVRAAFLLNLGEMADVLERMKGGGNWETQMANGLMEFGLAYPEFAGAPRWVQQGFATMVENALSTVHPDGCLHEPAIGYHTMCMRRYANVMRRAAEMNLQLPPELPMLTERMYEYVMYATLPDGTLPAWGDANPPVTCPDLVSDAALFGRQDFLYVGTRGGQGTPPAETSRGFPDGGYFFMRTGWTAHDHYLAVRCGPFGSHGHHDALGLVIAPFGRLRVYDPGVYNYGTPECRELSSTASHSTVTVDGADASSAHVLGWSTTAGMDYFIGESDGSRGIEGVRNRRAIVFAHPDGEWPAAYAVFDDALGEGEHDVVSRYRFVPGPIEVDHVNGAVWSADDEGNLLVRCLNDGTEASVVDRIAVRPDGEFGMAPTAEFALTAALPVSLSTLLLPFDTPAPPEHVAALVQPTEGRASGRAVWLEIGERALLLGTCDGRGSTRWRLPGGAGCETEAAAFVARFERDGATWKLVSQMQSDDATTTQTDARPASLWFAPASLMAASAVAAAGAPAPLAVSVSGRYFEVNGRPTFLLGNREGFVGGDWNREYWNQYEPELDYEAYAESMSRAGLNWVRANGISMAEGAGRVHVSNTREDAPDHPPQPPFTRRPWLRTGPGAAWDGLPRYDLNRFDDRYFTRLAEFVAAFNERGIVVEFIFFHQHNIYQIMDHYADNPFRPENNVNDLELPTGRPTAYPDFYLVDQPRLRAAQEAYVDRVLNTIGGMGVIFTVADEYNWTAEWIAGWAERIRAHGWAHGYTPVIMVGATHEPTMTLAREGVVDAIDVSHFGVSATGEAHSVGLCVHDRLSHALTLEDFTAEGIYSTIQPLASSLGMPIVRDTDAERGRFLTSLVSGAAGAYYHGFWQYGDAPGDPATALAIRELLRHAPDLATMRPADGVLLQAPPGSQALASNHGEVLAYVPTEGEVGLSVPPGFQAHWFDPRTHEVARANERDGRLHPPGGGDWVLMVTRER